MKRHYGMQRKRGLTCNGFGGVTLGTLDRVGCFLSEHQLKLCLMLVQQRKVGNINVSSCNFVF